MNIGQEVYNALCKRFDIEPTVQVESVDGFPNRMVVNDGEGNSVTLDITYTPRGLQDEPVEVAIEMTVREHFQASLEQASRIVAGWPEWKRNLLKNGMKPTTTPREPIKREEDHGI